MKKQKLYVVLGPTASGKTQYAINLAREINGAVISADSRQVYAEMNIGTAKPQDAWRDTAHAILDTDSVQGIDHYLLNVSTPDKPIALAQWQQYAFGAIDHALASGKTPLLVGGTMLYIDSVVYNYDIPEVVADEAVRLRLEKITTEDLYAQLLTADPGASSFIENHHRQRIIRALEVIEITGRPFSEQRRQQAPRYDVEMLGLFPTAASPTDGDSSGQAHFSDEGWSTLRQRIKVRSQNMFDTGLLNEVRKLQEKYGDIPLMQTMGYKQAGEFLNRFPGFSPSASDKLGQEYEIRKSLNSAVELFCQAQAKYARRQISWWKRDANIRWISQHI